MLKDFQMITNHSYLTLKIFHSIYVQSTQYATLTVYFYGAQKLRFEIQKNCENEANIAV